jgi:hypothetical protein
VAEKIGMTIWKEVMRANLPHLVYSLARTTRAREVPDK